MFILFFTSLFYQSYAAFFINISGRKFYLEYQKNFIFLVFMLYLIFIDQVANCIVSNGNILTDCKWRCYNEMGRRICYRYNEL